MKQKKKDIWSKLTVIAKFLGNLAAILNVLVVLFKLLRGAV